jgi:hypothetical protein
MTRKIKCFISSDLNTDLTKLELILERLNVEIQNFYDFAIGNSFEDIIKRKIRDSDFVIAFVNRQSQNVLFDVGMAEAFGKPIFLLIEDDVKVPIYLERKMYYQIDWTKNTQLLELSLKNYIQDITGAVIKNKKKKSLENLSIEDTNDKLISLRNYRKNSFKEIDLINIIMDVFEKINVQAVSELSIADKSRVDIAISNENLTTYFGNPLLIEVKSGHLNTDRIESAQIQLLRYIDKTDAHFGILLYFDKENKRFKSLTRFPNILMFDLEDFIQGISSYGFENFLIQGRNDLVHGHNSFERNA